MRNPTRFIGLSALALLAVATLGGVASAKDSADPTNPCIRSISCDSAREPAATDPYVRSLVRASDQEVAATDPYVRSLVRASDHVVASASDPYVRSLISPDTASIRVVTLPQEAEKVFIGNPGWGEEIAGGLAGVTLGMALMGGGFLLSSKRHSRTIA